MTEGPTADRANRTRGGDGKYRRDLEHVERDAQACRLASQGLSYREIAARLGYSTGGDAHRAVQKVLWETARQHGTEELRQRQLAELAELRQAMWSLVSSPPPLIDRLGRVVRTDGEDGQPVPDAQAQVAAAAVLLRTSEREGRLRGLDAPRRSVSVTGHAGPAEIRAAFASWNPADIDAALAEVRTEIARAEAEAGTPDGERRAIPGTVEP